MPRVASFGRRPGDDSISVARSESASASPSPLHGKLHRRSSGGTSAIVSEVEAATRAPRVASFGTRLGDDSISAARSESASASPSLLHGKPHRRSSGGTSAIVSGVGAATGAISPCLGSPTM